MEAFLATHPTTSQIRDEALRQGMILMAQDGVLRVLEGITSFEEIARITEELD